MTGTARHGDLRIAYEVFGPPGGEPLLLISATDAQMLMYPAEFCTELVEAGFQVVRFDNRDAGLSTHLTGVRAPGPLVAALRPSSAPYRLTDMAGDAVAVLDAMGWESAHVAGTSMGGMIAQTVAIDHPGRVRSLTSMSSTPSVRIGTRPPLKVLRAMTALLARPVRSAEEAAGREVAIYRLMGSPGYPLDEDLVRSIGREAYDRHPPEPEAGLRQRAAVAASGDRRKSLGGLRIPALVIHGDADVMMRPKAGRATAAAIPGARLVMYPGMGHDLPRPLWPSVAGEISRLPRP
ncbi:alpha/beta fold hydrolase [Couchioplanes caeruleus]|uniref:alpha/beta fold hydrolase n=1 Tax=Couchioplanes caeruleus TaxID=56438 RepID=UPI0020C171F0|nr:alpha/beta hydrolase [Couchioplanes caeruleus]UQU65333.1 alpha/beta fold hydrolase [Couchioplanes caeruleus]